MKSTDYSQIAKRLVTSRALICVTLLLLVALKPASSSTTRAATANGRVQGKIVILGILNFQDETDSGAPPELGRKIAQQLKQLLAVSFKDIVPKSLSSDAALSVEQAVAIGRKNAVQFVVRGGVLALTVDTQSNVKARVYAEIISVDSGAVSIVNAEGTGASGGGGSRGELWRAIDLNSPSFASSAPGAALTAAIDSLANSLHQTIYTQPSDGPSAASENSGETTEPAPSTETASAESDDELRQLIAQAEEIVANSSGDTERLRPVSSALDKLKAALVSRASGIENGADPTKSDQEIAAAKTELQSAVTVVTEQSASSSANSEEATPAAGEKKSLLGKIDQRASDVLGLLHKIQELRAGIRGVQDGATPGDGTGQTEDVSGVVMQEGDAVAGVEVVDEVSGIAAITGPDGGYTLKALPSGRLSNLVLKKNGKQLAQGQIDVLRGRVADFEIKQNMAPNASALRVVPSATVLKGNSKDATGSLKGTAKDQAGRPLPRALVSLNGPASAKNQSLAVSYSPLVKNAAVARTDSEGRYRFLAVPPGEYLVTIRTGGSKPVSTKVTVKPNVAVEVQSQLTTIRFEGNRRAIVGGASKSPSSGGPNPIVVSRDRALGSGASSPRDPAVSSTQPTRPTVGALQGQIVDASNRKPISGATVSTAGRKVRTDQSGGFEFEDLNPGAYRVKITSNGFLEDEQSITIRAGATSRNQFALKPLEDSKRMVRVVPEASRVTTPVRFGQVRGRVVDAASGAPIAGAVVAVAEQQRAVTGRDGSYSLNSLPPGSYEVRISRVGFAEKRTVFTIKAGEVTDASFRLTAVTRRPSK